MDPEAEKDVPKECEWQLVSPLGDKAFLFCRHREERIKYSLLYVHSFPFLQAHKLADSEKFNIQFADISQLQTTGDKLRYYRYKKALRQSEVAEHAGICTETYSDYELGARDYYPPDKLKRIAELLEVPLEYLLDDYNRFLYDGQAEQLRAFRKERGPSQSQLAKQLSVALHCVKQWERGKVRMTKPMWERFRRVRKIENVSNSIQKNQL